MNINGFEEIKKDFVHRFTMRYVAKYRDQIRVHNSLYTYILRDYYLIYDFISKYTEIEKVLIMKHGYIENRAFSVTNNFFESYYDSG